MIIPSSDFGVRSSRLLPPSLVHLESHFPSPRLLLPSAPPGCGCAPRAAPLPAGRHRRLPGQLAARSKGCATIFDGFWSSSFSPACITCDQIVRYMYLTRRGRIFSFSRCSIRPVAIPSIHNELRRAFLKATRDPYSSSLLRAYTCLAPTEARRISIPQNHEFKNRPIESAARLPPSPT